ncbi:hypothetical protein BLA29_000324, partial [Euroglyphus maynei]
MARENQHSSTANLLVTIPNNNNNNVNISNSGSSNSDEQKNITFVHHYQQQQQQLQQPQTSSSFGQGNLFTMKNNNQFMPAGNNRDVIHQQMADKITNNNLVVVDSGYSFVDNRCDDLNSPSLFVTPNNHSLPPVQTILNNNISSFSNNLPNYQPNIINFDSETSFNCSLENEMNFNNDLDPILDDFDFTGGKYLEFGLYNQDENNCNQPISSSLNILNDHDLYNSTPNIMPSQLNELLFNHNHQSVTSDQFIGHNNFNNDEQIVQSVYIDELSNFKNNEYVQLDSDGQIDSNLVGDYFGTKKQKLLNGNSKHLKDMTLTQYNSLDNPVDNHKNNRRYNGIWPDIDLEMEPSNFNDNQNSKILMATNNIVSENNNSLKRPYPFVDDS